jgi:hypothetical protein
MVIFANFSTFPSLGRKLPFDVLKDFAPVTNVAVNTVWGAQNASQANGVVTLINAIRSALVSLGLLKGS